MIIRQMVKVSDWDWICSFLNMSWSDNTTGIVAVDETTGDLMAAMVCENWTENSVQCHFIMQDKRAFRGGFHNECCRYVFTIGDREKMIGIIPSDNEKALKLDKHFGFTEVATIKDAFKKGVDAVIMEMHRDNCPYWDQKEAA